MKIHYSPNLHVLVISAALSVLSDSSVTFSSPPPLSSSPPHPHPLLSLHFIPLLFPDLRGFESYLFAVLSTLHCVQSALRRQNKDVFHLTSPQTFSVSFSEFIGVLLPCLVFFVFNCGMEALRTHSHQIRTAVRHRLVTNVHVDVVSIASVFFFYPGDTDLLTKVCLLNFIFFLSFPSTGYSCSSAISTVIMLFTPLSGFMEEGHVLHLVWSFFGKPTQLTYLTSWGTQPPPFSGVTLTAIEVYKNHQIVNVYPSRWGLFLCARPLHSTVIAIRSPLMLPFIIKH